MSGSPSADSLRVAVDEASNGEPPVVRVSGDIDLANVGRFEEAVVGARGDSPVLTIDLSGVNYCDSAAVRALFALAATTKVTMVVSQASQITTLFAISGLDRAATVVVKEGQ